MVKYTISLKLKGSQSPPEGYPYSLDLTPQQENNPNQIFNSQIRENMKNNLQTQSSCKINDNHLNQMIKAWIEDIKEGYRSTTITLDLQPLMASQVDQLQEMGNQEIPALPPPEWSEISPFWGMPPPLSFC